jgi:hypothetical protein
MWSDDKCCPGPHSWVFVSETEDRKRVHITVRQKQTRTVQCGPWNQFSTGIMKMYVSSGTFDRDRSVVCLLLFRHDPDVDSIAVVPGLRRDAKQGDRQSQVGLNKASFSSLVPWFYHHNNVRRTVQIFLFLIFRSLCYFLSQVQIFRSALCHNNLCVKQKQISMGRIGNKGLCNQSPICYTYKIISVSNSQNTISLTRGRH